MLLRPRLLPLPTTSRWSHFRGLLPPSRTSLPTGSSRGPLVMFVMVALTFTKILAKIETQTKAPLHLVGPLAGSAVDVDRAFGLSVGSVIRHPGCTSLTKEGTSPAARLATHYRLPAACFPARPGPRVPPRWRWSLQTQLFRRWWQRQQQKRSEETSQFRKGRQINWRVSATSFEGAFLLVSKIDEMIYTLIHTHTSILK